MNSLTSSQYKKITGPSSASKSKRKGKAKGPKHYNITDFDIESCFLGTVIKVIAGTQIGVKNLKKTDEIYHCSIHGNFNHRNLNIGSLVVFSKLRENTGEIISFFSPDLSEDLCTHFKIPHDVASKEAGISTNITRNFNSTGINRQLQTSTVTPVEQSLESVFDPRINKLNKKGIVIQENLMDGYESPDSQDNDYDPWDETTLVNTKSVPDEVTSEVTLNLDLTLPTEDSPDAVEETLPAKKLSKKERKKQAATSDEPSLNQTEISLVDKDAQKSQSAQKKQVKSKARDLKTKQMYENYSIDDL